MRFSLASFALLLNLASATPTPPLSRLSKRAPGDLPTSFVAFGDSYSAGIGSGNLLTNSLDQRDNTCARTTGAYPYQLAHKSPSVFEFGPGGWTDFFSCTGDKLQNIDELGGQIQATGGRRYDVGTLSIVGNDFFFGDIAKSCIYKFLANGDQAQQDCETFLGRAEDLLRAQAKNDEIWTRYSATAEKIYRDVLNNDGLLLITGYAQFFADPVDGDVCDTLKTKWGAPPLFGLTSSIPLRAQNRRRMNDLVKQVNDRIEEDVVNYLRSQGLNNIKFVDIDSYYQSHRFCEPRFNTDPLGSANDEVWFIELNTPQLQDVDWNAPDSLGDTLSWDVNLPGLTPSKYRKGSTFHPKPNGNEKVSDILFYQVLSWVEGEFEGRKLKARDGPETTQWTWGPNQYCMGFSHGGGKTCFDIPADCGIINPLDNTTPTVYCADGAHEPKVVSTS